MKPSPGNAVPTEPIKADGTRRPSALYVHVPFCLRKCRYCDFYSLAMRDEPADRFVAALLAELCGKADDLHRPLTSAFFGGGTPTVLGKRRLERLIRAVCELCDADTEFSVETNPRTVTPHLAAMLAERGVNRVNVGAQSFIPGELRLLGRVHDPGEVAQAFGVLRAAGIENIALDLIYGIPGQTRSSWRASLEAALSLRPAHLSCYALSFEPGTPLESDLRAGLVAAMDESLQRTCYDDAIAAAEAAGMELYEISNFALPGRRCRHNLTYWHNEPYLGVGPGAASFVGGVRRTNRPDLEQYVRALMGGRAAPCDEERLTGRLAAAEGMMLGLRLTEGVKRKPFADRYGLDPAEAFPRSIARYAELGALVVTPGCLRLAREYLFVADTVLADVLAEAREGPDRSISASQPSP